MGNFRIPGPVCASRAGHGGINDGTLARTKSPVPSLHLAIDSFCAPGDDGSLLSRPLTLDESPLGASKMRRPGGTLLGGRLRAPFAIPGTTGPVKAPKRPTALGKCGYLNPQLLGRVQVPREHFDRLRKQHGTARISPVKSIKQADLARMEEWPDQRPQPKLDKAVYQEVTIDGHMIRVIRPPDDVIKANHLPSMQQLAEALRTVPTTQLEMTDTIMIRLAGKPGSRGESGSGKVELFPVVSTGGDARTQEQEDLKAYRADPQAYFDALVTHECAHNYQGKFWHGPEDVASWKTYAEADTAPPSRYARDGSVQEDFAEFIVLFNAAKGTPCEESLRLIYPNRWDLLTEYEIQ